MRRLVAVSLLAVGGAPQIARDEALVRGVVLQPPVFPLPNDLAMDPATRLLGVSDAPNARAAQDAVDWVKL